MKVLSLNYTFQPHKHLAEFLSAIERRLCVFDLDEIDVILMPEYMSLPCETFYSPAYKELGKQIQQVHDFFIDLANKHSTTICAGSWEVEDQNSKRNRVFIYRNDQVVHVDKAILTPEDKHENIEPGNKNLLVDIDGSLVGIANCYESEFPNFVYQLASHGAKVILVPSFTTSLHGAKRIEISARARAIENQCFVVTAHLIAETSVANGYGQTGIYTPVDGGFPEDGILCQSSDHCIASLDLSAIDQCRNEGQVRNFQDFPIDQSISFSKIKL